jgi:hypothetical protein
VNVAVPADAVNWRLEKLKEVSEKASAYAVDDALTSNPSIRTPVKMSDLILMKIYSLVLSPRPSGSRDGEHRSAPTYYFRG